MSSKIPGFQKIPPQTYHPGQVALLHFPNVAKSIHHPPGWKKLVVFPPGVEINQASNETNGTNQLDTYLSYAKKNLLLSIEILVG